MGGGGVEWLMVVGAAIFLVPLHNDKNVAVLVALCLEAYCACLLAHAAFVPRQRGKKGVVSGGGGSSSGGDAKNEFKELGLDPSAGGRHARREGGSGGAALPANAGLVHARDRGEMGGGGSVTGSVACSASAAAGRRWGGAIGSATESGEVPWCVVVMMEWIGRSGYFALGNSNRHSVYLLY